MEFLIKVREDMKYSHCGTVCKSKLFDRWVNFYKRYFIEDCVTLALNNPATKITMKMASWFWIGYSLQLWFIFYQGLAGRLLFFIAPFSPSPSPSSPNHPPARHQQHHKLDYIKFSLLYRQGASNFMQWCPCI